MSRVHCQCQQHATLRLPPICRVCLYSLLGCCGLSQGLRRPPSHPLADLFKVKRKSACHPACRPAALTLGPPLPPP